MRSPSASAGEGRGGAGVLGPGQQIQRPPAPSPTLTPRRSCRLTEITPDGPGRRAGPRATGGLCLRDPAARAGS